MNTDVNNICIYTYTYIHVCQRTSFTLIIEYTRGFLHAWCTRSISSDRKIFRWCPILALPSHFSLSISLKGILSRILPVNCEESKQNLWTLRCWTSQETIKKYPLFFTYRVMPCCGTIVIKDSTRSHSSSVLCDSHEICGLKKSPRDYNDFKDGAIKMTAPTATILNQSSSICGAQL